MKKEQKGKLRVRLVRRESKPMSHWGYDDDGNPLPMLLALAVGIVVAGIVIAELLR